MKPSLCCARWRINAPCFVPRPLGSLDLAGVLKQTKPQEAATVYQQVKTEFPDTTISEEADRGLGVSLAKIVTQFCLRVQRRRFIG